MRPLNFAILKYLTTVDEACPEDIIEALKGTYGSFRALNKKDILSALMTAEVNGLVQESRFELDDKASCASTTVPMKKARPPSTATSPTSRETQPYPHKKRDRERGPFSLLWALAC